MTRISNKALISGVRKEITGVYAAAPAMAALLGDMQPYNDMPVIVPVFASVAERADFPDAENAALEAAAQWAGSLPSAEFCALPGMEPVEV